MLQNFNTFLYNLVSFLAKDSTDAFPLHVGILFFGLLIFFIISTICAKYIFEKNLGTKEKINSVIDILAFIFFCYTLILPALHAYPTNIDVQYEPGQYQELKPEEYKFETYYDGSRLSSRKVINYRMTVTIGHAKKDVLVNDIKTKYEKDPQLSEYSDKYHKKTLTAVRIRPVKVTTTWHGIKEVYDLYQVEEIYKVEPDLEKYQDEKTLNKVLDK